MRAALTPEPARDHESAPNVALAQLVAKAHALAGLTLRELSERVELPLPAQPKRAKGYIGRLIERALGAGRAENARTIDFPELGLELKTLPVDASGKPRESTFVCHVDLKRLCECEWESSRAFAKLARVLFVPIESDPTLELGARRIGRAFVWAPSPSQLGVLRADYDELAGRVGAGELETLTGYLGHALQLRPKAANARARARAADADGAPFATYPRAFYLRASFTQGLVQQALAIHPRDRTVF